MISPSLTIRPTHLARVDHPPSPPAPTLPGSLDAPAADDRVPPATPGAGLEDAGGATSPELQAEFARLSPSLRRFFMVRTGRDGHLADDLLQQLFLAAGTNARKVPAAELEFWLRGVARNLVTTHWRRLGSRPTHVPAADPALAGELADRLGRERLPGDVLARREVQDQLLLALTDLPADEQDLIVAHYFRGEMQTDIAARLNVSPRAIEGRLYRARQGLRDRLRHLA
jgi:RNA polymerase sigma-70 factor (ECF subfamily)